MGVSETGQSCYASGLRGIKKYMNTIITAALLGITIIWQLPADCSKRGFIGCYYPGDNKIYVDGTFPDSTKQMIVGHELGHACGYKAEKEADKFGLWLQGATTTRLAEYKTAYKKCQRPKLKYTEVTASISAYCLPGNMANGEKVHQHSVACPSKYKLGTKFEIYGKQYVCHDRMGAATRDKSYFDIWMPSCADAVKFGRRRWTIKVYDN